MIYKSIIRFLGVLLLIIACVSCQTPKMAAEDAATSGNADLLLGKWVRTGGNCGRPELTFTQSTAAIFVGLNQVPTTFDYSPVTYAANGSTVTVQLYKPHPYLKALAKDALTFALRSYDEIVMKLQGSADRSFIRCVETK
jgi:hypothetical protein